MALGSPSNSSELPAHGTNFPERAMKGQAKEYWMDLCERAANEQDPAKLLELVAEINRLLEAKEKRLQGLPRQRSDKEYHPIPNRAY